MKRINKKIIFWKQVHEGKRKRNIKRRNFIFFHYGPDILDFGQLSLNHSIQPHKYLILTKAQIFHDGYYKRELQINLKTTLF